MLVAASGAWLSAALAGRRAATAAAPGVAATVALLMALAPARARWAKARPRGKSPHLRLTWGR